MVVETIIRYYESLLMHIPISDFYAELVLIIIAISTIVYFKGVKDGKKGVSFTLLIGYVVLIYSYTVVFRVEGKATGLILFPFWSYNAYINGIDATLLSENLMNLMVFIPVGLLLRLSQLSGKKAVVFGSLLSIGVELSQLVFKRGLCETDDVIHNTLGCFLGYVLADLLIILIKKVFLKVLRMFEV